MIEFLGIKLSYEALGFMLAFLASEVIGSSKLKSNSLAQLAKTLIDTLKETRTEDEKVKKVVDAVKGLDD